MIQDGVICPECNGYVSLELNEYKIKVEIYKELFEKLKKFGNIHLEEKWDEIEEEYKLMRTDKYIKAIELFLCSDLEDLKKKQDTNCVEDEQ